MVDKKKFIILFCSIFCFLMLFFLLFFVFLTNKEAEKVQNMQPTTTEKEIIKEEPLLKEEKIENTQSTNPEANTNTKIETNTNQNELEELVNYGQTEEIDHVLDGFTNQIYNYDSQERRFYEGTEIYMTQQGYERFVPADGRDGTQVESEENVKSTRLFLNQIKYYYHFSSNSEVTVMVKADITSSFTNQSKTIQWLDITLIKQDGWLISNCEVIDTLYQ